MILEPVISISKPLITCVVAGTKVSARESCGLPRICTRRGLIAVVSSDSVASVVDGNVDCRTCHYALQRECHVLQRGRIEREVEGDSRYRQIVELIESVRERTSVHYLNCSKEVEMIKYICNLFLRSSNISSLFFST